MFTHPNGASNNTSIESYENNCNLAHKCCNTTLLVSVQYKSPMQRSSLCVKVRAHECNDSPDAMSDYVSARMVHECHENGSA